MISTPAKSPRSGTTTVRGAAAVAACRGLLLALQLRLANGPIVLGPRLAAGRRGRRTGVGRLERRDHAARRDAIAGLHFDVADLARGRRRNVHRGLVGLERDQALLRRHRVARLDEHFDDLDVGKVTKIGYDDFHGVSVLGRLTE